MSTVPAVVAHDAGWPTWFERECAGLPAKPLLDLTLRDDRHAAARRPG